MEKELEEAAEVYANKKGDIPTTKLEDAIFKQGFIDGATWMQKRMYSEEEVESLLHKYMQSQIPDWHGWSTTKWFEQFKKK